MMIAKGSYHQVHQMQRWIEVEVETYHTRFSNSRIRPLKGKKGVDKGMPVTNAVNKQYQNSTRASHNNRARKGRGQPRFYPVTKEEPSEDITQDMPRKVELN